MSSEGREFPGIGADETKPDLTYPQHTCLRGEDGECAPVYAGLGIKCKTCKRYWHSGDEGAREIEQFMIRQRAQEVQG